MKLRSQKTYPMINHKIKEFNELVCKNINYIRNSQKLMKTFIIIKQFQSHIKKEIINLDTKEYYKDKLFNILNLFIKYLVDYRNIRIQSDMKCLICYDNIKHKECVNCCNLNHFYHYNCINQYKSDVIYCPYCNTEKININLYKTAII